jgi:hypothetical protein
MAESEKRLPKRDKRQKFRVIAERRTNKALDAIKRIGNLSNRQIYEFEDTEIKKIMRALRDAVSIAEGRFGSPKNRTGGGFSL